MKKATIYFFDTGQTAAFNEVGQQIPELQQSWLLLYVRYLEEIGYSPLDCEFKLPLGKTAVISLISDNEYNWSLEL